MVPSHVVWINPNFHVFNKWPVSRKLGFTTSNFSLGPAVANVTHIWILSGFCLQQIKFPEGHTDWIGNHLHASVQELPTGVSLSGCRWSLYNKHPPLAQQWHTGRAAPGRRDAKPVQTLVESWGARGEFYAVAAWLAGWCIQTDALVHCACAQTCIHSSLCR